MVSCSMKVRSYVQLLAQFFVLIIRLPLGSITHLVFPSRSHLISCSEDGTLCLFRARDWAVLRLLRGHKGPVNSVAVHPSGKLALSVGKDRTMRMWDLMRGKGVASTKLGKGLYLFSLHCNSIHTDFVQRGRSRQVLDDWRFTHGADGSSHRHIQHSKSYTLAHNNF